MSLFCRYEKHFYRYSVHSTFFSHYFLCINIFLFSSLLFFLLFFFLFFFHLFLGFGAFAYILASILLVSAAINTSPLFCSGTENEKKMLRSPQEIEQHYGRVLIWFDLHRKNEGNELKMNFNVNALTTMLFIKWYFFILI